MRKAVIYIKKFIIIFMIGSMVSSNFAYMSSFDGSNFVTKAEYDSAIADFNGRLTSFEISINSIIDKQVTSYLDRNGIWSGKDQDILSSEIMHNKNNSSSAYNVMYIGQSNDTYSGLYPNVCAYIGDIDKSGLLFLSTSDMIDTSTQLDVRKWYISFYNSVTNRFSDNSLYLSYRFVALPSGYVYKKNDATYSYSSGTTNYMADGFNYYDENDLSIKLGNILWDDSRNKVICEYQPYSCIVGPYNRSGVVNRRVVAAINFGSQSKIKNYVFVKKGQKVGFIGYFTYGINAIGSGNTNDMYLYMDSCWLKTKIDIAKVY